MIEWDFRAADTYLAAECTDVANSVILGHPIGAGGAGYPAMSIWATIAPDDPNEREDIIITSISGAAATIVRGIGYSSGIAHRMGTPVRLGVRAGAYPHDFNNVVNFQNSWGNLGGAFEVASYRRHPSGLVEARGWVDGGTINTPCFTLPPGYRPRRHPVVRGGREHRRHHLRPGRCRDERRVPDRAGPRRRRRPVLHQLHRGSLVMRSEQATVADLVEGDVLLATASGPVNGGAVGATVKAVGPSRFIGPRPGQWRRVTCSHGLTFNLPADQQVTVRR
jgi:hypothetical protein